MGCVQRSPKITHVIFDCDGLLLDTETVYTECFSDFVREYGETFDVQVKRFMMGKKIHEVVAILLEHAPRVPLDVTQAIGMSFREKLKPMLDERMGSVRSMPGAADLVSHLHSVGIPLAIATSSDAALFQRKAKNHQSWISLVDVVVNGDDPDVKHGKPAPDLFLTAARRLHAAPEHCLVFEDAPNGVQAARAAGMRVVAVPDPLMDRALYREADAVLNSLAEFDPAEWGLPGRGTVPRAG